MIVILFMPEPLNRKILIVSDDGHIKGFLSDYFALNGYRITLAGNGIETLDLLEDETYCLLIADMDMPEMDGIELVIRIRSLNIPLPIIVMSSGGKKSELLKAGADYFLLKPFGISQLRTIIYFLNKT